MINNFNIYFAGKKQDFEKVKDFLNFYCFKSVFFKSQIESYSILIIDIDNFKDFKVDNEKILIIYISENEKSLNVKNENAIFLTKPIKLEDLKYIILENFFTKIFNEDGIITYSKKMLSILNKAKKVAVTDATCLLTGQTGVGKELLANFIVKHSKRSDKPFIKINCAAIPPELLESELFGYERGAFTGAISSKIGKIQAADKGTVFLDEITTLPLNLQAKLLRLLQNKELQKLGSNYNIIIDVRFIAAANQNLEQLVKTGSFREDLYYRLNTINFEIPPLKERKEDIFVLAHYFLFKFSKQLNKKILFFSPQALNILLNYEWPGNVRELENTIQYSTIFAEKNTIEIENLPTNIVDTTLKALPLNQENITNTDTEEIFKVSEILPLKEVEKLYIKFILEKTNYNISKAAKILQVDRKTIYSKIKKYGWQNLKNSN